MSLIARAPSNLSSFASESPVKRSYESQSPWSAKGETYHRTRTPVVGRDPRTAPGNHHKQFVESSYSVRYSGWDGDKAWSSQEWKPDELIDDRTETPVVCRQRGARPQQIIIGNDEAELELSSGSRSFLDRVNDQVRKRQKRSSMNVTENDEKHSVMWRMFMSVTLESAVFMRKNYSDNWHSIKNTQDLTMKQMFDISATSVSEQDEIYAVKTNDWEIHSWKYLTLTGDEQVMSLQRTKVYVFSDSVLCLGKIHENSQSNAAWEQRLEWFKTAPENRNLDRIDGDPMEFEWNIFPRIQYVAAQSRSQKFTVENK